MRIESLQHLRCPRTFSTLTVKSVTEEINGEIISGKLMNSEGEEYDIIDGIPNLIEFDEFEKNQYAISLFKDKAKSYDDFQHLSFETFFQKEEAVRNSLIEKLNLDENSTVLEVNAGTGRDSVLIFARLGANGSLHVQDISLDMLQVCRSKFINAEKIPVIHQSNGSKLPYSDNFFDAVYSFGGVGMNTYAENRRALKEIVRVTRTGGRVVFGGLSLAPWLRHTRFGKILINHNEHYANPIVFDDFPVEARNVSVQWILNGAGFVVDFTVGTGEPEADFEYEIPGSRGGSLLTRYYGKLEGVTPEAKELAARAREKLGVSMHKWLDDLIKREAKKILNQTNTR